MRGATMPEIRRMHELRRAGLSFPAIAKVIKADTGRRFTAESVRHYARDVPKGQA